jgi:FdhD protein
MKGVKTYEAEHFEGDTSKLKSDLITEEKPLRILINGDPFTVTMRTPGNDQELTLGLLYNEDIVKAVSEVNIEIDEGQNMDCAHVSVAPEFLKDGYMNARNFLSVSSCGVCGKTELPVVDGKISATPEVNTTTILDGLSAMKERQANFERTGGCHAAAVLDATHQIISIAEDIGRHNAVDKVIGDLLLNNSVSHAKTLLVSGRVSYEIVIKCFRAKIPVIAAVSAPSSLAIDYAKELGVTVFAFCRQTRLTRFS